MADIQNLTGTAAFFEHLTTLPLARWYEIACAAPAELPAVAADALSRALSAPADAWDIWHTRDDVETVLYRFDCMDGRILLRGQVGLPHVRQITERAALAVLVRDGLSLVAFDACYGPFARAIPLGV